MNAPPSRGLPPRITIPVVLVAAFALVGTVAYFLRIGLGVTGAALGPSAPLVPAAAPTVAARAPGEAAVPQSGGVPVERGLPGKGVGGGGPAAGGPPPQVAELLAALRTRIAKNPNDREALLDLAGLYVQAGKFAGAVPLFARAVALAPADAEVRTSYAEALQGAGEGPGALRQLEVAVRAQPDSARTLFDLGAVAGDMGKRALAVRAFRRFLTVAPNDPRAKDARSALHNLGAS